MINEAFEIISEFVIGVIDSAGLAGIFSLMTLESSAVPIPSEIIMPFSGFLVFEGRFNFFSVVLAGVLGNLAGSLILYYIGYFGGRPFIEKYGRYFLFHKDDLEMTERWFLKYGKEIVILSRMIPAVRTYISFVPGITKMNVFKFTAYTFFGCIPWVYVLTYAGVVAGENWNFLHEYFKKADWAVAALIVLGVIWFIRKHIKNNEIKIKN